MMYPSLATGKVIATKWQQLSNEENSGWLGYIGDYTTQLYVPGSKLPLFPYNRGWSSTQ